MTVIIQCLSCYAFMGPDAVDDMDMDQCPTCGEWTDFDEVESISREDLLYMDLRREVEAALERPSSGDDVERPLVCRKCGEPPEVITDIDYNYCDFCGFTGYLQGG